MLEDRLRTWDKDHAIADVFLYLVCCHTPFHQFGWKVQQHTGTTGQIPHLNAYSEYCANYGSALICLNKKAERERMAQFLEKTAPLGQHAKLPDYLILPVQRIPVCLSPKTLCETKQKR